MDGIFDKNENLNLKLIAVKLASLQPDLSPTVCTQVPTPLL